MVKASSVSFSGSVASLLLASGFRVTLDAQQPPESALCASNHRFRVVVVQDDTYWRSV